MPIKVTLNFDKDAIRQHVLGGSTRALERVSATGQGVWETIAPMSNDPRTRGGLRASWFAGVQSGASGPELRFGADAPYAKFVEFGTSKMPAQAPLRRTAGQLVEEVREVLPEELGLNL